MGIEPIVDISSCATIVLYTNGINMSPVFLTRLKQYVFPLSVFITGACVLIIEIAARVLTPYYGNTVFTTSGVITVILIALSVGYYVGGRFADRHPHWSWFFGIIMVSGLLLLGFYIGGLFLLPLLRTLFHPLIGPILSALILFLFPAFLLGTLSPYAITLQRLQIPESGVGRVSGVIFFWSTLGSITGSLLVAFVLIPVMGINTIFIGTGIVLFLLGIIPLAVRLARRMLFFLVAVFLFLVVLFFVSAHYINIPFVYAVDGVYERVAVQDGYYHNRPARFLRQNTNLSSGIFLDADNPTDLAFIYSRYFSLYKIFTPNPRKVLVLGGGAYSVPNAYLTELPDATVDVAEIEPILPEIAEKYFGVERSARLRNYVMDGRQLLFDREEQYDVIFGDAYSSFLSVPFHLTTHEFFSLAKRRLNDDGVFIGNFIGRLSEESPSFLLSEIRTFKEVFPNSYFFAVVSPQTTNIQNIIFLGHNSDTVVELDADMLLRHSDPILASLNNALIDTASFDLSLHPILTDDYAPVDYFIARSLLRN